MVMVYIHLLARIDHIFYHFLLEIMGIEIIKILILASPDL